MAWAQFHNGLALYKTESVLVVAVRTLVDLIGKHNPSAVLLIRAMACLHVERFTPQFVEFVWKYILELSQAEYQHLGYVRHIQSLLSAEAAAQSDQARIAALALLSATHLLTSSALVAPETRAVIRELGIELGNYRVA